MNCHCYEWNIFTRIRSGVKFWLDIYHWGASLAVTEWICDVGQNIFPSFFFKQKAVVAQLLQNFLPYHIPEGGLYYTYNTIIILWICYTVVIILCINNNVITNNSYGRLQVLILLFKILMGTRKFFFRIYRQFGHAPSERIAILVLG